MAKFSKKQLACQYARIYGFDYAYRDGLFNGQALYVADNRWWHRKKKHECIGFPFYIVVEKGKPRKLNHKETWEVFFR